MIKKRKIVKNYHKNGSVSYTIKYRVWPFWFTEEEDMGYYTVVCKEIGNLSDAIAIMERLNKKEAEYEAQKIVKRERVTIKKEDVKV